MIANRRSVEMKIAGIPADGLDPVSFIVEWDRRFPISGNLHAEIVRAVRKAGPNRIPDAFVWNDFMVNAGRDFSPNYVRVLWPLSDPLLLDNVSAAARCAVRKDVLQRLAEDGSIAGPEDTSGALAALARRAESHVVELEDVHRFTGNERSPAYQPSRTLSPPARARSLSIIINYRDHADLTCACIKALAQQSIAAEAELILIDNQSTPENRRLVEAAATTHLGSRMRLRHVEYDAPFNKSAQDNLGAELATGEILLLLNNDTRLLDRNLIQTLCDWAASPNVASAGPRFVGRNGRLVSSGVQIRPAMKGSGPVIRESEFAEFSRCVHYSAGASFACAAVSRAVWFQLGGMNPAEFKAQYNDADFDLRALNAGFKHIYVGHLTAYHEPGRSEQRTKEMVRRIHDQLVAKYPEMGRYHRLDPDRLRLKAPPQFDALRPKLATASVQMYCRLRRSAAPLLEPILRGGRPIRDAMRAVSLGNPDGKPPKAP